MNAFHTTCKLFLILSFSMALTASASANPADQAQAKPSDKKAVRQLDFSNKPLSGDFDQMLDRRMIRAMVPYSRSIYFNDKGHERGLCADLIRDFERRINKKYAKTLGKRPLTIFVIPTTRDKLLPEVAKGMGDIAVGNLTVTEERLNVVDFISPEGSGSMKELVVTGPKSPAINSVDDLSGKMIHVRKSSSYYESLDALNGRFKSEGKAAVKLILVPEAMEDEDMMEMVNAGILEFIVVDDWKARMWAQILPEIRVNDPVAVREGGKVGTAIRKGCPKLEAELLDFYHSFLKKQDFATYRLKRYMSRIKQIQNSTGTSELKRFAETLALFEKYGQQYNFDPLMLAAQGYQESQLNQNAKSRVGAIGIMQVMPDTGRELNVGDISIIEPNIHAGARYLDKLMTKFFSDANFTENNRTLFAFASYNCGPGNVSKMRNEAVKLGLDPDVWFNNVEIVTAQKIGMETTTYVRNIFKYYVAYSLLLEAQKALNQARDQIVPGVSGQ